MKLIALALVSFGAVTAFTENIVTEQQSELSKRQEGNTIEVNAAGSLEKRGQENELVKRGKGKKGKGKKGKGKKGKGKKRKGKKRRLKKLRQRLAKLTRGKRSRRGRGKKRGKR